MILYAILRPRPVLIKPLARIKAQKISQIVVLPKPPRASLGFKTFVKTATVTPMKAIAPIGMG